MSSGKHTRTPWHTAGTFYRQRTEVVNIWGPAPVGMQSGEIIASEVTTANAEFIVRACNSHAALLEAAKEALALLEHWSPMVEDHQRTYWRGTPPAIESLVNAISKAEHP